ncbi:membrane protein insertase YidC [Solirhodobacter olei]|uniref:membrane protein insertase YidC n=1 Tax=Solirhodobacter olei TaxID=2493082 RepID=UPI000FDBB526|nr:membrane protein insertase YidC [Solirhodobacter olei]
MDDQNKNLILATALSFIVILVWFLLFPPQDTPKNTAKQPVAEQNAGAAKTQAPAASATATATAGATATASASQAAGATPEAKATAADLPTVKIDTPRLEGSISVQGGRIDSLQLKGYKETLAKDSPLVRLLSPVGKPDAYYVLYGWAPGGSLAYTDVPGANTVWTVASKGALTPKNPLVMTWNNGKGLVFTRRISVDDNYMFTVTQGVKNTTGAAVTMEPYGMIVRHGLPPERGSTILHEGVVQMTDGKLDEIGYGGMRKFEDVPTEGGPAKVVHAKSGWIGFTDKYWMTSLIPETGKPFTAVDKYTKASDIYQLESRLPVMTVAPGASAEASSRVFAGAKEYDTLRMYQNQKDVPRFVDSIDWGWFFFLTKPIYWLLHKLHILTGNVGIAIICLVIVLKLIVLPLAYKSYVSMARMKELQPEMEALKERAGDDKQKLQKEMMQLYKEKKVNPAAGCLPMLFQIPIFFSLYKVIYVTIELRQAPFFGWIRDLSAPDPSSWMNLFGVLPFPAPMEHSFLATLSIGALPILLGITMWLQQKLNPAPADATQKMIFAWMPWVFMFMLGHFASGLVLYYITNNTLTFLQQYMIMRSHGHPPDIFGNIRSSFKRGKSAAK